MTKKQLITWSIARDALDFVAIGQIPPFSWVLDVPLIIMHFSYAGSAALITLFELIPIVGLFPFFTVAAFSYPDNDEASEIGPVLPAEPPATTVETVSSPLLPAPDREGEGVVQ